jgi:fumarate reductase flavoprotein subunit
MPLFAEGLAGRDNDALRRVLCDEVPDAFRWLTSLGVRFHGPMPEPPHRQPRMHNVLPNSLSYIYHLGRHARRVGVDVQLRARATELMVEAGRVTGVVCDDGRRFRARRAVILAAGDFTSDPELKSRYMGAQQAKVEGVNATATGDGHKLALPLGARILNGDLALGPELRFIAPRRTTLVRRLPPWPALGRAMDWAMHHVPQALLRPLFVHNEGGLAVDLQHRVLGASGEPIAGLYAAGATGQGGLLLKGHGHHLAWAFVSGRRAGRFAASAMPAQV